MRFKSISGADHLDAASGEVGRGMGRVIRGTSQRGVWHACRAVTACRLVDLSRIADYAAGHESRALEMLLDGARTSSARAATTGRLKSRSALPRVRGGARGRRVDGEAIADRQEQVAELLALRGRQVAGCGAC